MVDAPADAAVPVADAAAAETEAAFLEFAAGDGIGLSFASDGAGASFGAITESSGEVEDEGIGAGGAQDGPARQFANHSVASSWVFLNRCASEADFCVHRENCSRGVSPRNADELPFFGSIAVCWKDGIISNSYSSRFQSTLACFFGEELSKQYRKGEILRILIL